MSVCMSKKRFIKFLEKDLEDDDIILLSQTFSGTIKQSKKKNSKSVQFDFPLSAFAHQNGIGHIAFGKTPVAAICICKPTDVTEEIIKLVEVSETT